MQGRQSEIKIILSKGFDLNKSFNASSETCTPSAIISVYMLSSTSAERVVEEPLCEIGLIALKV